MVDELRALVIGCGNMGVKRIKSLTENKQTRLVSIVDRNLTRARNLAKEYGAAFNNDPLEAMEKTDPDLVFVSTPNKYHVSLAQAALKRDIHVLCEKPLARNPEEALTMVETALHSNAFLKTGSNLRYFPSVTRAKELLEKREIGGLLFLRGWIGNAGWHLERSWNSWFGTPDLAGGGTLLDNGAHMFDLIRWFIGEIEKCLGVTSNLYWETNPLEDTGLCILESVDGKLASFQSSWIDWAGYMYVEIYGTEGYIRIDNRQNSCITILGKKDGSKYISDYSLQPPTSYKTELADFINSIKHEKQPFPSGFDGLRAVQMAFGVYESARTGKRVLIYGDKEKKLKKRHEEHELKLSHTLLPPVST